MIGENKMYKYKNDIYDLCSKMEEKILEAFCSEINTCESDVFVIMAHKAVRLFQILLDQKHIESHIKNKIIISSHALDFDCTYLCGKKVTIVDDILISGTSIASTVHKLLDVGVSKNDIDIITLAIDKCYQGICFDDEKGNSILHCKTYLEDSTCIELSYTISKIFSYYGMPYDIDYPNYTPIQLNAKQINLFFNDFFWCTNKISNQQQEKENIDSFVLLPNECVRQLLWKRMCVNLEKIAHLKIKVYVRNFPSGKKESCIVPMCLFDEILEKDIDILYNIFKPKTKDIRLHNDVFISKLRYLQFYFAHQLYLVFKEITSLNCDENPTENSIKMLFGSDVGTVILSEINTPCNNNNSYVPIENLNTFEGAIIQDFFTSKIGNRFKEQIKQITNAETKKESFDVNRVIFMPFLWWYDTKEIPVRNDLAKNKYHFIEDYSVIKNRLNRLNSGFSFSTLKNILKEALKEYECEQTISLFIDRAIDEGIIVPTIYHDNESNYLCRAYRHGEDLPFGLQDECRLLHFLNCLREAIPYISSRSEESNYRKEGIATISFEKMIVMFYQMGIEQGDIFNRFLGFDNIKLLKPFLSMHGTVEGFVDPQYIKSHRIKEHFYSEKLENGDTYITWLTKWLTDNGFIEKIKEKTFENYDRIVYVINCECIDNYLIENERSCISPIIKRSISNIATMISTWYNTMSNADGKDEFKEDAVALTSCYNSYVYASAIATEVRYFSKFWQSQVYKALENSNNTDKILSKLVETDEDKEQTINMGQALYSGRNKVEFFNKNRASKVIQKVAGILDGNGVNIWAELWSSIITGENYCTKDLKTYTDQVIGFLYFYSACYECLRSKTFWEYGKKPVQYEEYKRLYGLQCAKTSLLKKELFSKLDEIYNIKKFTSKKEEFVKLIEDTIEDSEDAIKNIEIEVGNGASNYTIRYKSSLIFEVDSFNPLQNNNRIMAVWDQLEEDIDKTQLNIVVFPKELCDSNCMRYGVFYGSSSLKKDIDTIRASKILSDIYTRICDEFDGKAHEIKAMMIPDTPPGKMFKHNIQRNIVSYIKVFKTNIIDVLKTYYEPDTKQQMVVATTDYIDSKLYGTIRYMQWDNRKDHRSKARINVFSKVRTYYNSYVHPNVVHTKDVAYSVVRITCGDAFGTGFLLRTHNNIVCITCNHILLSIEDHKAEAISVYNDEIRFLLQPIKKIKIVDEETLLPASEELAILKPELKGRIPIDMRGILSVDDLNCTINEYFNSDCICCGYPNGEQCWSDSFRLIGSSSKGYFQTRISESDNSVKTGYSGGVIVLEYEQNRILGIHEGRYGGANGRMIPCGVILDELKRSVKHGKN